MLRKLSSLFCVAALSIALVGCADSQVEESTGATGTDSTEATTEPHDDETEALATPVTEEPVADTDETEDTK